MNPTYKEYVFDFADLKLISVSCNKCRTETILDVTETYITMPDKCSCGQEFGQLFSEALESFHRIYKQFTHKETKATARIRIRREINVADF